MQFVGATAEWGVAATDDGKGDRQRLCFGGMQVKIAQVLLVLVYTLFMSSFGALVGALVIARRVAGGQVRG